MKPDLVINLAQVNTFLHFSSEPDLLDQFVEWQRPKTVIIDEIQGGPVRKGKVDTTGITLK